MANTSANYRIKLAAVLDTKTINQQINQLNKNNTLKELKIKVTISDASLKKIKELNDLLNKTEALNKYTSGLKNIQETMKSYEKIASKVVTASKNAVTATDNIGKAAKSAEPKVKSFGDKASDAFKKFSLWSAVSSIFYQVINAVKGLVNTAIELDSAFTELQKVTDLTMDDFDELTEKAYNLGSEVAKTTTEAINAMTEFAKAGYSVEESTDILAKNALMWTNIADGTVDASESANMIISVMKAFNIEAENTTHIIDALNEVSNNFAVSSGDLSDSLTRSSAVLANAGVTFEEQLGLITAGTEILRNANVVSNGLKTISLRLQGMEEDGEAVDGLSAKLESDFNNLGLTLYDTNGALKSTYEILADLASIYPSLTEAEKAYYTELIAGKNRAQVAAAILNNFNTALRATETAYDSTGSAAAENAKVMESLNGHIKMLKAEWESLVNSKGTQETLKFFVDLTTNVIKLIKALGGLPTILILVTSLLVYNKWAVITAAVAKFGGSITTLISGLKLYSATLGQNSTALITNAQASSLAAARTFLFNAAIAAAVIGLVALVKIVQYLSEEYERNQESAKKAADEYKSANDEVQNLDKQIKNLTKQINDLNKNKVDIVDEQTLITLKAERAELELQYGAMKKIANMKKEEASQAAKKAITGTGNLTRGELEAAGVDTSNAGLDVTGDALTAINPLIGLGWTIGELTQGYGSFIGQTVDLINANEELNKQLNSQEAALENLQVQYTDGDISKKEYEKQQKKINKSIAETKEKLEANNSALSNNMTQLGEHRKALNLEDEEAKKYADTIDYLTDRFLGLEVVEDNLTTFDAVFAKATADEKTKLKELADAGNLTIKTFNSEVPRLAALFDKFSQETGISFSDIVNKIGDIISATQEFEKVEYTVSGFTNLASTSQEAWLALKAATEEYAEQGYIATDTLVELTSKYPAYLDLLLQNEGDLSAVTDALKDNTDEYFANAKAALGTHYLNQMMQIDWQNLKYDIAGYTSALIKNKEAYNEYQKNLELLDTLQESLYKDPEDNKEKTNKNTKDLWVEEFEKAYNDLKNRRDRDIIDTKTYYAELDKLNNKYFKDRVKYEEQFAKYKLELYKGEQEIFDEDIDKLDHQIAMMEYNEVDTETLIAKHREAQARIHEEAERYRKLAKEKGLEGVEDIINKYEELWWEYETSIDKYRQKDEEEIQERFEAIQKVAIEAIDAEIEALENDLEKQNNLLDEAIARYEEENDALEDQKEIQEKLLAIEEARKKLAEAKNNKVRVYREGKGFVYETDFDAVAEAQSELDSLLEEWDLFQEKSKIADIIAQLEAEKEANEKRVEEEIKDLNRLKDEWDKSLDLSEDIENYKTYLEELGEEEQNSFDKRLQAVKDFTAAYKAEMATLNSTTTTTDTSAKSGISNYASGQRGSGKNSYNVYTDYQKLLNEAIASGAPADHLAYLEQKRNNKIDGEGLDYEKTYNYQYVPNKSGSSSSSSKKSSSGSSHSPVSQPASEKSSGSSLKSAVTSVIKSVGNALKSITGLASGTESADGLAHFVGEGGPELYVPPKGSGIIPNPATTNLMAWGAINPMNLVRSVMGNENNTNIKIDNITLPNVKDADSFIKELKNFKSFAIQKQSVRR